MRIISGIYKGRRLKTVEGLEVRPTSDRLRETVFNILAPHLKGSYFLDLCAGSGAIGIEALSRGASEVIFVDNSRRACAVIKENLAMIGIKNEARIIQRDAIAAMKQLEAIPGLDPATEKVSRKFDVIYFDPPYASEIYASVLTQLAQSQIINEDSILVVEHRTKTALERQYGNLQFYREVKQGESALAFYSMNA